ncbi:MAG: Holliday junction branch migration protein RuvA [Anaerolineae bacterium]|nr:MAG: Holliday junction branch migration protein RuvA [Anaerolineae bacterium]
MITSLRGILQRISEQELTLEVGGVGLQVAVTRSVLESAPPIGRSIYIETHLVVRQDALLLYGFSSQEEREVFLELVKVSGVGPRLALATLSSLSIDTLRLAVANNQPEALVRVPGIGKKTAERIVFHLKDRIAMAPSTDIAPTQVDEEVVSVLTALGYSPVEAQSAVHSLGPETPDEVEERVKLALQYFAKP